jgi:hypothetical protein
MNARPDVTGEFLCMVDPVTPSASKGDGFSSILLNFERWSSEQVLQWIDALPDTMLSLCGRKALMGLGLTGEDLAGCTNCHVVSSTSRITVAPALEEIAGLTREDVFFLCDELDALRELRIIEDADQPDAAERQSDGEGRSDVGLWSSEWVVRNAPPVQFMSKNCCHMNSDTDDDDSAEREESKAALELKRSALSTPEGPSHRRHDEFDDVLEDAVLQYQNR